MIAADFLALAPHLTLLIGSLVVVLLVSFVRHHALTMVTTVLVLLATLASIPVGLSGG